MIEQVKDLRQQIRRMVLHEITFDLKFDEVDATSISKWLDDWMKIIEDDRARR